MNHVFQQIRDLKCFQASINYELKEIGVKAPKYRKLNAKPQENVKGGTVFGCYLCHAPRANVTLQGFTLNIPNFLIDATTIVKRNIKVEGIFRKAGSVHRQNDIKRVLEKSGVLTAVDVHDAANLLKQFLRQLAVPLIPRQFQESLLKALDLSKVAVRREAILLLCLLLPMEHLHVLRFVMDFFSQVAENCASNRMDVSNLATVLTPNIFVLQDDYERKEKDKNKGHYLQKQTEIVKFLIENANSIGWVPDHVLESCVYGPTSWMGGAQSEDELDRSQDGLLHGGSRPGTAKKNRKKRNSLNGVFNGLRRMVQPNRVPTTCYDDEVNAAPHFPVTPVVPLKRKHEQQPHDEDVDEDEQHSSSKKRALERPVHKTKSLSVPFHLDSPNPFFPDDVISLTPAPSFLSKEVPFPQTRKSGRIKFFKRKNSLSQTPKNKKDLKNRSTPNAQMQNGSSSVGRRLSGEDLQKSPSVPLLSPSVSQPLLTPFLPKKTLRTVKSKAEGNFTSYLVGKSPSVLSTQNLSSFGATGAMRGTRSAMNVAVAADQRSTEVLSDDSLSDALDKVVICDQQVVPHDSGKAVSAQIYRVDLPKPKEITILEHANTSLRCSKKAARRSVSLRVEPAPSAAFGTPTDRFARPWNNKSSLRRGRPNTVTTGLPVPSPFKIGSIGGLLYTQSAVELCGSGDKHKEEVSAAKEITDDVWKRSRHFAPTQLKERGPREPSPFDALAAGKISKKLEFGGLCDANIETDSPVPFLVKIDSGIMCEDDVPVLEGLADRATPPVLHFELGGDDVDEGAADINTNGGTSLSSNEPVSTSGDGGFERPSAEMAVPPIHRNTVADAKQGDKSAESSLLPAPRDTKSSTGIPRDNVAWRNAEAVINELKAASGGGCVGRPSLLRLMKDKAGLVSQTARRYDAIAVATVSPGSATSLSVVAKLKSGSPVYIPEIFKGETPHARSVATPTPIRSARRMTGTANVAVQKSRELFRATSTITPTRPRRQPSGSAKHANGESKENENSTPTRTNYVKKSVGGGSGTPLQTTRSNSNCKARIGAATRPMTAITVGRSKSLKVASVRSPLSEITPPTRVGSQGSLRRSPRVQEIRFRANVGHPRKNDPAIQRPQKKRRSGPRRSTSM